jgi:hypothetical protein
MALFQKSVLNKFIKSQDTSKIDIAYERFASNFHSLDRQAEKNRDGF